MILTSETKSNTTAILEFVRLEILLPIVMLVRMTSGLDIVYYGL